jgi:PAS domain S-box-containing protein
LNETGAPSLHVLLVDDDEADRLAVRRCLQQSGLRITVDQAETAAEALGLMRQSSYACVLLDYYLPDVPNEALFFREIRSLAPGIPIVMFTGRGDEDIAVELMKAGAADYVPKASLTPERIAASLRHAIELARVTSAQKQAEDELREHESRFRTLANAIPQLAWMTDADGARNWFNDRWFDYTGTTFDDMKGWGWTKVHHPDHVDRVTDRVLQSCAAGEPWEETCPLRGRDGRYRWFLSRAFPFRNGDGSIAGWVGTNTDVTDQKNAEAEKERLLALEHEARHKAERATVAREELLAIVAHDLRNPLQVVMSGAARIARSQTDESVSQYVGHIQRASLEMDRLIRDLLDVSRMESGNFAVTRTEVDLPAILRESCETFEIQAREARIVLQCEIDSTVGRVNADRDRLHQVLSNVLGNALKFTPPGGRIVLRARRGDGCVEIAVQDTGSGIPAADLSRIFERFWQGDRASRAGAGLGLSICKGIIEAHDGQIWVESTLGEGTTLHMTIPIEANRV